MASKNYVASRDSVNWSQLVQCGQTFTVNAHIRNCDTVPSSLLVRTRLRDAIADSIRDARYAKLIISLAKVQSYLDQACGRIKLTAKSWWPSISVEHLIIAYLFCSMFHTETNHINCCLTKWCLLNLVIICFENLCPRAVSLYLLTNVLCFVCTLNSNRGMYPALAWLKEFLIFPKQNLQYCCYVPNLQVLSWVKQCGDNFSNSSEILPFCSGEKSYGHQVRVKLQMFLSQQCSIITTFSYSETWQACQLHRRGYRSAMHAASLNESAAAGLLRLAGWPKPGYGMTPYACTFLFTVFFKVLTCNKSLSSSLYSMTAMFIE